MTNKSETDVSDIEASQGWHLGRNQLEMAHTEFQHALICLGEAFYRFAGKNLSLLAGDSNLTGSDSVILHTIHSADRPKSVSELQHFTNRSDTSNIQYSVRKLLSAGLIKQAKKSKGRGTSYLTTEKGKAIVEEYVKAREELLAQMQHDPERLIEMLNDASNLMAVLTGLYDRSSRLLTVR